MPKWFRRFAEIPGVDYPGSQGVKRSRLKWHDAVPRSVGGFLSWPSGSSASPAHEQAFKQDDKSIAEALNRVSEALELPGEPVDYHFAIQGVAEFIRKHHREDPSALSEMERLAWLDLRLVEACPECVSFDGRYVRILAFAILVDLYTEEGFIREALEVAERAQRFQAVEIDIDDLRQRIARIESEHVG